MMFRKYFSLTMFAVALSLMSAVVATAQSGQLRGHVKLKQADGTTVPAVGAAIDVIRLDIGGKYETKTDKRGEFVFAGLPYVGTYIIGASLANAQPSYQGNVKVGRDIDYEIEMTPGDGHRLTEAELKQFSKGGGGIGPDSTPKTESAADKAKRQALIKENEAIEERNKKNRDVNEVLNRTFKAGQAALYATPPNYDEAIKQFDEGIAAAPDEGILYSVKAEAYKNRGVERYNAGIKSQDPAAKKASLGLANEDFKQAAEISAKAVELIKKEQSAPDPAAQTTQNTRKLSALSVRKESMKLFVSKVDQSQADAGLAAYEEYMAAETDPAKKLKALRDSASLLLEAGAMEKSQKQYEAILAQVPNDIDAIQKLGVILISLGEMLKMEGKQEEAKVKKQEGVNYLQQFVEKGPDGQLKTEAKEMIDNQKDQENIKPEKVNTAPKGRRKP